MTPPRRSVLVFDWSFAWLPGREWRIPGRKNFVSKLFSNVPSLTHERMSPCWFVVQGSVPPAGGVELKAGDHEIKVEFFDAEEEAGCILSWETAGKVKEVVPASVLFHKAPSVPTAGSPP